MTHLQRFADAPWTIAALFVGWQILVLKYRLGLEIWKLFIALVTQE
jgi:hypothetical protein